MDRVGPRLTGRFQNALRVEVAFARGRRADLHRLVGVAHVWGAAVGLRIHRDGLEPELAAGAEHPAGDLPSIRDKDRAEQRG